MTFAERMNLGFQQGPPEDVMLIMKNLGGKRLEGHSWKRQPQKQSILDNK